MQAGHRHSQGPALFHRHPAQTTAARLTSSGPSGPTAEIRSLWASCTRLSQGRTHPPCHSAGRQLPQHPCRFSSMPEQRSQLLRESAHERMSVQLFVSPDAVNTMDNWGIAAELS
ncbi:hypothetical protein NDU88_002747 [Pleurodeles waltl]|uniref:Uncharacterized protein n=1 Tax=Pleurodeles waltl TaxID=8319 RepID=A0AAV7SCX4_PLEWA|nr:hypothetical protein NDU88_002747 [Pleurodeles waltl]